MTTNDRTGATPGPPEATMIYDRVWRWRVNLPERHGQLCRIVARGKMNSCQIEFEDGERHIVSRNAIRKIAGGHHER